MAVPRDASQNRYVRDVVRAVADGMGLPEHLVHDAVLAASELFANAVREARPATTVRVRLVPRAGALEVRVTNEGPGFRLGDVPDPVRNRPGGRGLAIARALGPVTVEEHAPYVTVAVVIGADPARS